MVHEYRIVTDVVIRGKDRHGTCVSRLNQAKQKNVGFLNPFLYENVAKGVCKDVVVGTNAINDTVQGYNAGPGWDACTGLGTPDGTAILNNL